jgi:predicted RNA-binding protein with PIN domain
VTRAEKRAASLQGDVKRLREELDRARAREAELPATDVRALADVAAAAEQVASTLRAIERRAQTRPAEAPADTPRPRAPSRRTRPTLPPGVAEESPEGIDAMLRADGVLLVVDGYNVTKRAWPDASPADQRERLGIGVTGLHRRVGCGVLVVFDGDGSGVARPVIRRGGVRVMFSDAGEEADEVIVREVAALPKRVRVVVVSSDAWVREHTQAEGAVVVGADAFLRVLRPER